MSDGLLAAFPSSIREAASKVVGELPPAPVWGSSATFTVSVTGDEVRIPERIYTRELPRGVVAGWTRVERDIYACLYTRHHDGYVRQHQVSCLSSVSEPWVIPFVVRLIGEYVVEIVADIKRRLSDLESPGSNERAQYARFVNENPAFMTLTAARVASYWDCYYRRSYPRLSDYPAFQLLASLQHVGASHE